MKCPEFEESQLRQGGRENKVPTRLKSVPYLRWSSSRLSLWSSWKTSNRWGNAHSPCRSVNTGSETPPSPSFLSASFQWDRDSFQGDDKLVLLSHSATQSIPMAIWVQHNSSLNNLWCISVLSSCSQKILKSQWLFGILFLGSGR